MKLISLWCKTMCHTYNYKKIDIKLSESICQVTFICYILEGTFSVKFEIYVCQTTIFRGVLNNCPIYFYHPVII